MNLTLTRTQFRPDGIFGLLTDENGNQVAVTLEHAYQQEGGAWAPKIPIGTYTCQRGQHQLEGMKAPFITFQVMNVPGHSNILLHMGNFDNDSEGCILLGREIAPDGSEEMITDSDKTFAAFMNLESGVNSFTLTVS